MERLRSSLLALSMLTLVPGCPSATTRTDDGGTADAATTDAPTVDTGGTLADTGGPNDAAPSPDTGIVDVDSGAPSWDLCTQTSQCELAPNDCCGPCGIPALTDYDAVNRDQSDAHFMDVCPVPTPCPGCAVQPNANLIATCTAQHCRGVDLSTLPLSECASDTDCVLRFANCCACSGTDAEVVSIRADGESAVSALLCDTGGCPTDCIPMAPTGFFARCDPATHHCAAVRPTR